MKFLKTVFFLFAACLISCQRENKIELADIILYNLSGDEVTIGSGADSIAVIVFMSPDCPVCINYTKTLNDISQKFSNYSVNMTAVFPGKYFTKQELMLFADKYNFGFDLLTDENNNLAKALKANVTPEVFVIKQNTIMYSGAIDNLMYETGKKRVTISEHYLENALSTIIEGGFPSPGYVEPFGCLIE